MADLLATAVTVLNSFHVTGRPEVDKDYRFTPVPHVEVKYCKVVLTGQGNSNLTNKIPAAAFGFSKFIGSGPWVSDAATPNVAHVWLGIPTAPEVTGTGGDGANLMLFLPSTDAAAATYADVTDTLYGWVAGVAA